MLSGKANFCVQVQEITKKKFVKNLNKAQQKNLLLSKVKDIITNLDTYLQSTNTL